MGRWPHRLEELLDFEQGAPEVFGGNFAAVDHGSVPLVGGDVLDCAEIHFRTMAGWPLKCSMSPFLTLLSSGGCSAHLRVDAGFRLAGFNHSQPFGVMRGLGIWLGTLTPVS